MDSKTKNTQVIKKNGNSKDWLKIEKINKNNKIVDLKFFTSIITLNVNILNASKRQRLSEIIRSYY